MLEIIKKMFIGLLNGLVNASNHTKRNFVNQSEISDSSYPSIYNMHPNEYS